MPEVHTGALDGALGSLLLGGSTQEVNQKVKLFYKYISPYLPNNQVHFKTDNKDQDTARKEVAQHLAWWYQVVLPATAPGMMVPSGTTEHSTWHYCAVPDANQGSQACSN